MRFHPRLELAAMLLAGAWCLTACATLREHPYATSFAVAFAAGSIAASQNHDNRAPRSMSTIGTPSCANPAVCQ